MTFNPKTHTVVSISALESMESMVKRLQEERDMLMSHMNLIASAENSALDLAYCKGIAKAAISKCTESTKVMQ